jgi:hypothetical protein
MDKVGWPGVEPPDVPDCTGQRAYQVTGGMECLLGACHSGAGVTDGVRCARDEARGTLVGVGSLTAADHTVREPADRVWLEEAFGIPLQDLLGELVRVRFDYGSGQRSEPVSLFA